MDPTVDKVRSRDVPRTPEVLRFVAGRPIRWALGTLWSLSIVIGLLELRSRVLDGLGLLGLGMLGWILCRLASGSFAIAPDALYFQYGIPRWKRIAWSRIAKIEEGSMRGWTTLKLTLEDGNQVWRPIAASKVGKTRMARAISCWQQAQALQDKGVAHMHG
ncbi:MAG: hypothetical protein ABR562_00350 [Thermoplasmatota archaeon]